MKSFNCILRLLFFVFIVLTSPTVQADTLTKAKVKQLYQNTITAINGCLQHPNDQTCIATAVNKVMFLQPYNNVLIAPSSNVGVYDGALNRLVTVVESLVSESPQATTVKIPTGADTTFGSSVFVDSMNLFISAPTSSLKGKGVIYHFTKGTNKKWTLQSQITPLNPTEGDHFGRIFKFTNMNTNWTLLASSEPANGQARVYVFKFKGEKWVQDSWFELTSLTNTQAIHKISLDANKETIVVGLPEYGKYMVWAHSYYLLGTVTPQNIFGSSLLTVSKDEFHLSFIGNISNINTSLNANSLPVKPVSSIAVGADENYIVIGVDDLGLVRILKGTPVLRPAGNYTEVYNQWVIDTEQRTDIKGYGYAVAVDQDLPQTLFILNYGYDPLGSEGSMVFLNKPYHVTVAIGSPRENKNRGAVYTMAKTENPVTQVSSGWSLPKAVDSLLLHSSTYVHPSQWIGYQIAVQSNHLFVGSKSSVSPKTTLDPVYLDILPSTITSYKLNDVTGKWDWKYVQETPFGFSLSVYDNNLGTQITAIGIVNVTNRTGSVKVLTGN